MSIREIVYLGHNNTIDLQLTEDGVPLSATRTAAITRVTMTMGELLVDSSVHSGAIAWSGSGEIVIDIGTLPGVATGNFLSTMVIYSADNPEGIRWEPTIQITVR